MHRFVMESDIDYYAIIRRGGANGGGEDFAVLRCPACGQIYLVDSEVDTLFLDATNLARRAPFFRSDDQISCEGCQKPLHATQLWAALRGDASTVEWQVPWDALWASQWDWVVRAEKRNPASEA